MYNMGGSYSNAVLPPSANQLSAKTVHHVYIMYVES